MSLHIYIVTCQAHPVSVKSESNVRFVSFSLPGAQGGFVGDPASLARDNILPKRLYVEQYRLIQMLCGGRGVTDVTDITDITGVTDIMDVCCRSYGRYRRYGHYGY